jgi:hypothetical protein
MLELEEIKQIQEKRATSVALTAEEMPLGMHIVSDDFKSKASIVSVAGDKICLSGPVLVGEETVEILTAQELLDNWLFVFPQGQIGVCGKPEDNPIITPSDEGFQFVK